MAKDRQLTKLVVVLVCLCLVATSTACRRSTEPSSQILRANAGEKRVLGSFRAVDRTSYLMAPIGSVREGEYFSSSGGESNVHNYVFFNLADESTRILLPTSDYLITTTTGLPEKDQYNQQTATVQWFLYFVVKSDTDGDKKLTAKDHRVVAISDAGGVGYAEIIPEVDTLFGYALRDTSTLFVIYGNGLKRYETKIDLPNRKAISTVEFLEPLEDLK